MSRSVALSDIVVPKSGNSSLIKGSLSFTNDGTLYPAFSATGQDVYSTGYEHEADAIIVSAVGARCGKCFLASGRWSAIANTHILFPKPDVLITRYLWYLVNDETFWIKGGSAQPFVKVNDTLKRRINLPSLSEQARIVNLLDTADELRKLRQLADRRTADLIPAIFHDMFGDPAINPKGWPVNMLPDVAFIQEGPGVRNWQFRSSGIKLVNVRNIVDGKLDTSNTSRFLDESEVLIKYKHFLCEEGDLVMATSGVTWGKVAEVLASHLPLCMNTSMVRLRPLNNAIIDRLYLRHFLESRAFREQVDRLVTGSAQPNFGPSHFKKIALPLPPITLQRKFAGRAAIAQDLESQQSDSLNYLDDLFRSLLHRAFEGEL